MWLITPQCVADNRILNIFADAMSIGMVIVLPSKAENKWFLSDAEMEAYKPTNYSEGEVIGYYYYVCCYVVCFDLRD